MSRAVRLSAENVEVIRAALGQVIRGDARTLAAATVGGDERVMASIVATCGSLEAFETRLEARKDALIALAD